MTKYSSTGKPSDSQDSNNPDWAPSINLGYEALSISLDVVQQRYCRALARAKQRQYLVEPSSNREVQQEPETG